MLAEIKGRAERGPRIDPVERMVRSHLLAAYLAADGGMQAPAPPRTAAELERLMLGGQPPTPSPTEESPGGRVGRSVLMAVAGGGELGGPQPSR